MRYDLEPRLRSVFNIGNILSLFRAKINGVLKGRFMCQCVIFIKQNLL